MVLAHISMISVLSLALSTDHLVNQLDSTNNPNMLQGPDLAADIQTTAFAHTKAVFHKPLHLKIDITQKEGKGRLGHYGPGSTIWGSKNPCVCAVQEDEPCRTYHGCYYCTYLHKRIPVDRKTVQDADRY